MGPKRIPALGAVYHDWVRQHPDAASAFRETIEEILVDAGVSFDRVAARTKTWRSLKAKAMQRTDTGDFRYPDPWHDIKDIIGIRITTYFSADIPVVLDVLGKQFNVLKSVDKAAETRIAGGFGYGSHHMILQVPEDSDDLAPYRGFTFEVQVRTVLQHAWAEFEHDIRYKGTDEHDPRIDRAFALAAGLIELADQQFDQIARIQGEAPNAGDDVELSAETLPGVLAMLVGNRFPRSRSEYYTWLEEILAVNGITTVRELRDLLDDTDIAAVEAALKYQFVPGQVRIIDDLLLRRYGRRHIERTKDLGKHATQRASRLKNRLAVMVNAGIAEAVD
ncbi:GTP pyrophosphokinase YwaC [Corynebacterium kalinowskii]|uniref:GTP pyrophosphokinase YwaC n=1 Tax=Corynebacterium kalinowskii TaxID=2675216 RepID=A0A6B8VLN1_9CORY|nr:GTP pyrophosphokinase family protein [Corynebacterium kalinowskii]QGU02354.1 GTP pyrophosphokinase YwaC [Corynebacterium kalinowskii]